MKVVREILGRTILILNGARYEKVKRFKYIGLIVTPNNKILTEINDKLASSNFCLTIMNKILTAS